MSSESVSAARTVRRILSSIQDHGVIDVFAKYHPQDLVTSIYALSRLQAASQEYQHKESLNGQERVVPDKDLVEDLIYYAPFASAAYGWAFGLATGGRLHMGDLQSLVKTTAIDVKDVIQFVMESRVNRPVSLCAQRCLL